MAMLADSLIYVDSDLRQVHHTRVSVTLAVINLSLNINPTRKQPSCSERATRLGMGMKWKSCYEMIHFLQKL